MIAPLRTLLAVAATGSFASAARKVGLTASAVGAQIRRVEEELGYPVFDRSGWSVSLTAKGQAVLPAIDNVVHAFDDLRDAPRAASSPTLRIGAISTAQTTLFAPAVARLRGRLPDLSIRMTPGVSILLLDRVDSGELDAAIMVRPPFGPLSHLRWHPLLTQDYVMIVPSETPGSDWQELTRTMPFIRYEAGSFGGRRVVRFLACQGIQPRAVLETEEVHTILHLVAAGAGFAIVPDIPAVGLLPQIRAVSLGTNCPTREIGVLMPDRPPGEGLSALLEALDVTAGQLGAPAT